MLCLRSRDLLSSRCFDLHALPYRLCNLLIRNRLSDLQSRLRSLKLCLHQLRSRLLLHRRHLYHLCELRCQHLRCPTRHRHMRRLHQRLLEHWRLSLHSLHHRLQHLHQPKPVHLMSGRLRVLEPGVHSLSGGNLHHCRHGLWLPGLWDQHVCGSRIGQLHSLCVGNFLRSQSRHLHGLPDRLLCLYLSEPVHNLQGWL